MARFSILVLCLVSTLALAQAAVPDTAAGRVFSAWLDAYNSGDIAMIDAYDAKHVPVGPKLRYLASKREESGVLRLRRIESSEAHSLIVLLRGNDSGADLRVELHVSEDPTPTVTDMRVEDFVR
jgi:hypothetical protein